MPAHTAAPAARPQRAVEPHSQGRAGNILWVEWNDLAHLAGRQKTRVADVYEVCGQAQKSVAIANLARFAKRVRERRGKTRYVRGTPDELDALLQRARNLRQRFEVVVAQPGISKAALSAGMLEALGATNTHLVGSGASPLRILSSA